MKSANDQRCDLCGGPIQEQRVTYSIEFEGRLHIIERVPARVCLQCGERLFSPETVEKIQNAIWHGQKPKKFARLPILDFVSI